MAATKSRNPAAIDSARERRNDHDSRRRSSPLMPMNLNSTNSIPSVPTLLSPPPTPLSPPPRPDRLSLSLRSNSGLKGHTNEAPLSQYIDYKSNGLVRQSSFSTTSKIDEDDILSPTFSYSSRRNSAWMQNGLTLCLPFLDFLGKDAFQMAMDNSSVVQHLLRYCEEQCCEDYIEFLLKIREYAHTTNEMAGVLTSISTKFTAIGATSPLNLPPMLSRSLNADVKRIAHSVLPSLESVFFEARLHIENRVASDIFPGFVTSQLAHCTAAVLASGAAGGTSSMLEYPGLGESFCLTDALAAENPVLGASDGFAALSGYPLADIIGQNCNFLQGPFSDPERIRRIQIAMRDRREAVELILNHRKDGEPFWNLLLLFPLKDNQGTVNYWLEAQINVSESTGSLKDVLRILNGGTFPDLAPVDIVTRSDQPGRESIDVRSESRNSTRSRHNSKTFPSRKGGIFQNFRKPPPQSPPSPPPPPSGRASADSGRQPGHPLDCRDRKSRSHFSRQRFQPRSQAPTYPTAYSQYIVLRYVRAAQPPSLLASGKKHMHKLSVAYYSDAAVDLLSIRADITGADIFHVLAEKANSPSITKAFKAAVRERIEAGKCITAELLLDRSKTLLGRRRNSSVGFAARPMPVDLENTRTRSEERVEKKLSKEKGAKQDRLTGHWVPLKDGGGFVDWVVLILTQAP